uniref:Uncharacterized protein n=1 Tax=Avena sativa TaxID=4498 RepID=A0ACD5XMQ0_AVESA
MTVRAFAHMELRCPWAFDPRLSRTLGTELDTLQGEATCRAAPPTPLKQPPEWGSSARGEKAFVMRVEDEDDSSDEDAQALGARFSCNYLELSLEESGSGVEVDSSGTLYHVMGKMSPEKSILLELDREHRLKIQEEIRSKLSSLDVQNEIRRTTSAFAGLQKYAESRKELDRGLDAQFQRKIAQVLDRHLSIVQTDHQQKSQIVERGLRDDAAVEEATRREQSVKEEKIKQQRTRQEAEARQRAAEAQEAAYEAAKKEAVEKEAAKSRAEAVSRSSKIPENRAAHATMANSIEIRSELPGIKVYADSSALKEESRRCALHDQVPSNIYRSKEYSRYDRQIGKSISKLMPTTDIVEARASELIKALDGQDCPRPIACRLFADKMISIVKSLKSKGLNLWKVGLCMWICHAASYQ